MIAIIVGALVLSVVIILVGLQFKEESINLYDNELVGYTVSYPEGWIVREFPDTKTGAGFRPEEIEGDCIIIDSRPRPTSENETPFKEYVETAAIMEIQGFEKLVSIKEFTTDSGLVGYKTEWIYRDFSGQEQKSLPITYFDNGEETIQIALEKRDYESIYNQMILSFSR